MIPAEFEYVRATSVDHAIGLLRDGRGGRVGSAYLKFENPASHYALVGVAVCLNLAQDGSIETARVGVTGAAAKAYRASATEAALTVRMPTGPVFADAAAHVVDGVEVNGDLHASSEYRAAMTRVFARRALETARDRARVA